MADDNQTQPDSGQDFLSMSDEEIMNMTEYPPVGAPVTTEEPEDGVFSESGEGSVDTLQEDDSPEDQGDDDGVVDNRVFDDQGTEEENPDLDTEETDLSAGEEDSEEEGSTEEEEDDTPEPGASSDSVDFEAAYKELFAPFKANGRDIQVHSVEDARRLMQMGANYNKKMQGLKPHLKIVKMLDNNDLLDESKLAFAMDLLAKKPEAIAKLVKDSGVDPLDIDVEKTEDYQPTAPLVSDQELEFDSVLEDIKHSQSYQKTLEVLNNGLDEPSRKVLLTNPQGIRTIHEHIENGTFDYVMGIVENERVLGRLAGLSDLDAYQTVGLQLQEEARQNANRVAHPGNGQAPSSSNEPVTTARKQKEAARKSKRKAAASPTGTATKAKGKPQYDPLGMSDEEFEKMAAEQGLSYL